MKHNNITKQSQPSKLTSGKEASGLMETDFKELIRKHSAVQKRRERKAHNDSIKQCVMVMVYFNIISKKVYGKEQLKLPYNFADIYKNEDDLKFALKYYQEKFSEGKTIPIITGFHLKTIDNKVMIEFLFKLSDTTIEASK